MSENPRKIRGKPTFSAWPLWLKCGRKEQGRKVRQHPTASKANVPNQEVTEMLCYEQYGDSADNFKTVFVPGGL